MFAKLLRLIFKGKKPAGAAASRSGKKTARGKKSAAANGPAGKGVKAAGQVRKPASVTLPEIPKRAKLKSGQEAFPANGGEDVALMIRQAVSEAEHILDGEREARDATELPPGANREQVLAAALKIHRSKQNSLGQLDVKERARLRALAEVMMGGNMRRTDK